MHKNSLHLLIAAAVFAPAAWANAPATLTLATANASARTTTPPTLNCGKNAVAATVSEYSYSGSQAHIVLRELGSKRIVLDERLPADVARNRYAATHLGSVSCVPITK
ncbi:MAG: hypothetical protein JO006_15220 [Paucibacter sp.]|nr:hypothetical protein [Roseateles sp.]